MCNLSLSNARDLTIIHKYAQQSQSVWFHILYIREKSKTPGKNIVEDRFLSKSGFTAVPQQSACMSWVVGRGRQLFEETSPAQWPLKCPVEADKRSQVQWKNPHAITTRGRYGVSRYCQESVPAANSSANYSIALLYGVKWCKNFLDRISIFWLCDLSHSCYLLLKMQDLFLAFCSFIAATKSAYRVITSSC